MNPLATTLPEHSNDGYVAAAYIVFFVIVLIYVAIMAVRLGRVERKVQELRGEAAKPGDTRDSETAGTPTTATTDKGEREHETV